MRPKAPIDLDTERSRQRATWLRRLAEGAAHSQFVEKLNDMPER